MMYTWIVKNAIDVAVGFWVLGLIRNNIFLDKAYDTSHVRFIIYFLIYHLLVLLVGEIDP